MRPGTLALGIFFLVSGVLILGVFGLAAVYLATRESFPEAIGAAFTALFGLPSLMAGRGMLRSFREEREGMRRPPGSIGLTLISVVTVVIWWIWSVIFLPPTRSSWTIPIVTLGGLVVLILGALVLRQLERRRQRKIEPWEWGLTIGSLEGLGGGLAISLSGGGLLMSLGGGILAGLVPAGYLLLFFRWWKRVGPEVRASGARVRWPLD